MNKKCEKGKETKSKNGKYIQRGSQKKDKNMFGLARHIQIPGLMYDEIKCRRRKITKVFISASQGSILKYMQSIFMNAQSCLPLIHDKKLEWEVFHSSNEKWHQMFCFRSVCGIFVLILGACYHYSSTFTLSLPTIFKINIFICISHLLHPLMLVIFCHFEQLASHRQKGYKSFALGTDISFLHLNIHEVKQMMKQCYFFIHFPLYIYQTSIYL